jgi:alpha-beta hydrolase superfamily lysophospholipase
VERFSDYVRDVRDLLAHLEGDPAWKGDKPPVLFGHSLGGCVASFAAAELGGKISGLAMTSPFFGVGRPVPAIQIALGKVVAKFAPKLRQPSGLSGKDMTHDVERVRAYDQDPLGFSYVTVGFFLQVQEAQAQAASIARRIAVPALCIAGGDDRVVSVEATRRFFDALRAGNPRAELDVRPGLLHEVLNEPVYPELSRTLADRMVSWFGA